MKYIVVYRGIHSLVKMLTLGWPGGHFRPWKIFFSYINLPLTNCHPTSAISHQGTNDHVESDKCRVSSVCREHLLKIV